MLDREPLLFAVGDTLCFRRRVPGFLPADGWSAFYEIRGGAAGDANITLNATTVGDCFSVDVPTATTQQWLPGDYTLAGFCVNAADNPHVRHQFYVGELTLSPNLGDAGSDAPTTHAQRMIPLIEAQLEQLAMHVLDASNIEKTELIRVKREAPEKQLAWNKTLRANEIAIENVANGKPSGLKVVPVMAVVPVGRFCGSAWWHPFGQ